MSIDIKRFLSLRLRKRFRRRAKNGLYVVLESGPLRHQIDDISYGGLSYHYIDGGFRPKSGAYSLMVVSTSEAQPLTLTGKTICESETGALVSQNKKIKRRSIRFERLNAQQKKRLKDIIKIHTTGQRSF